MKRVFFIVALGLATLLGANQGTPAKIQQIQEPRPQIADLAEALSPTVVFIESVVDQPSPQTRQMPNDPFHFFFREFDRGEPRPRRGAGSGVIIDAEGHIVTNHHVIENATKIEVTLNDERVFEATVVGTDPEIDLAVLKIQAREFTYASLGTSENLRVGEWVIAIGAPLGYRYTVTQGIISALNRGGAVGLNTIENYIQTDAAINQGNSGGPLLNLKGEVIGINTAISAMGQNIGFAVPIDLIKPALQQILTTGSVARGALGVGITSMDNDMKEYYGRNEGALVQSVNEGSPAEKAGIREGDLIISFDGKGVKNSGHLTSLVAIKRPGDRVEVVLVRQKKEQRLDVTLGSRRAMFGQEDSRIVPEVTSPGPRGSMRYDAYGFSLEKQADAYVVTAVTPGSPAHQKGLREGMRLEKLNNQSLKGKEAPSLLNILSEGKDVVLLEIETDSGTRLMAVKPETP